MPQVSEALAEVLRRELIDLEQLGDVGGLGEHLLLISSFNDQRKGSPIAGLTLQLPDRPLERSLRSLGARDEVARAHPREAASQRGDGLVSLEASGL